MKSHNSPNTVRPSGIFHDQLTAALVVLGNPIAGWGTSVVAAFKTFPESPGMSCSGRTSPYAATRGDDPVLAVNGRLPPDFGPRY